MNEERNNAYDEGDNAFYDGMDKNANPYDINDESDCHDAWNEGWENAEESYEALEEDDDDDDFDD